MGSGYFRCLLLENFETIVIILCKLLILAHFCETSGRFVLKIVFGNVKSSLSKGYLIPGRDLIRMGETGEIAPVN